MSQAGVLSDSTTPAADIEFLAGNSGGNVGPNGSGVINTIGTGSITVVGDAGTNTTTTQLTGLTNHAVLVGAGTATITKVDPSATSGVPLISQGAAADPVFGTALVAGGGTGAVTFNTNGVVISNTTTTGALASLSLTNGQIVIGSTGAAPVAATLTAGSNISITNGAGSITVAANTSSQVVAYTSVNSAASPYTVLTTDYYISVDTSGGAVTLRFPNAPTTGRIFVVKDRLGNAVTNNITITTVGGAVTIDGSATYTMNQNYSAIQLLFNGTTYEVF